MNRAWYRARFILMMDACLSGRTKNMMQTKKSARTDEEVTDRILTIPNVISFVRLCMAPVYLYLLFTGNDIAAAIVFAVAALTDFVDGQIARRMHCVSRIGQLLDPLVDRVLMITAVVSLLVVGRLPLWIVVLVLLRDLFLMGGGAYLLQTHKVRIAVVYPGKVATTFMFIGLAGLMLNTPLVAGLGWVSFGWLPGFNTAACSWGIWSIYIGLLIGIFTTVYYVCKGLQALSVARRAGA